jgi:hypothetical protein
MRDVTAQNWMLAWFAICTVVLVPIFPFILRWRRRRAQSELHDKIEKAKSDILADGIVTGPKGDYVPHRAQGSPTHSGSVPKWKGPYGPAT